MSDYIDNVVIKLKRKYSKDELVSHLIKKESEYKKEIGFLNSEKDELKYTLKKRDDKIKDLILKIDSFNKLGEVEKSEIREKEYVKRILKERNELNKKRNSLEVKYQKLNQEFIQLKIKSKE